MEKPFQNTTPLLADRQALRQAHQGRRMALSEAEWQKQSEQLSRHLLTALARRGWPQAGQVLAFCWPFRQEPDIRFLLPDWISRGVQLVLPVVVSPDAPLIFRRWSPGETLVPDRYGIPTPVQGETLVPNLLLLPGQAFDQAGYRLGYGAGFFDRTLSRLPRPWVCGLCFDADYGIAIDPQPHDQRVDALVTETGEKTLILPA